MARLAALLVLTSSLVLAACKQSSQAEMDWAKAALQRNSDLEIVATDQQSGAFTVRVKNTGELRMVKAKDLVASLPAADASSAGTAGGIAAPAPEPAAEPPAETPAAAEAAPAPSEPASEPPAVAQATPPASAPVPGEDAASQKNVIRSGPGYSIQAAEAESAPRRAAAASNIAPMGAIEHRYEPIICQGARMLHIDNRNLEFEGDAVTAEDGCELHITNSRISARGLGLAAKGANVHIKNSSIEGDSGSVQASGGAQVYAQSSTFRGLQRRLDSSVFHDLGGNVWN